MLIDEVQGFHRKISPCFRCASESNMKV